LAWGRLHGFAFSLKRPAAHRTSAKSKAIPMLRYPSPSPYPHPQREGNRIDWLATNEILGCMNCPIRQNTFPSPCGRGER
jgi:hypothetical protein